MAKQHGARQQKRLAKQRAKQKQRSRQLARQNSDNPAIMFQGAENWPVVDALEYAELWDSGIGNILLSRRTPNGRIAFASFLIDAWCLGVKDVFYNTLHSADYPAFKADFLRVGKFTTVSPERFSKIVHCAADYAQSLGIAPHRSFRYGRMLLAGIDPSLCPDELTFGKDGKPLFISGPYDSPERCRQIAHLIQGQGGHYVVQIGGAGRLAFSEAFDEEDGFVEEDEEDDDVIDVESSSPVDDDSLEFRLSKIPRFKP